MSSLIRHIASSHPGTGSKETAKILLAFAVFAVMTCMFFITEQDRSICLGIALSALMAALYTAVTKRYRKQVIHGEFTGSDLFQVVPCYISVQGPDLRIVKTNPMFKRDFGKHVGRHCYEIYKKRNTACPECPVIKTFRDGKRHNREETVVMGDGRIAQVVVYSSPILNDEGEITHVMEMITDITEVKSLRSELEMTRRDYKLLFDMVPCYIMIQDRNFKIIENNSLFKHNFGDNIGEYCYKAYKNRDSVCPNCPVIKAFEDGEALSREEIIVTKEGLPAHMLVHYLPIRSAGGEFDRVMEMATDITEVKQLERQLITTGKAVAGMAHRIKNILMGLEGGIFVMNTGMEEQDDNATKEGWEMIERNVVKISHVVKDMLYSSKARKPSFSKSSPEEIARDVHSLFVKRAKEEGLELILDIGEEAHFGLYDPDSLHSLMTNLIANAIDACKFDLTKGKEKHTITLRCYLDKDKNTVIEVSDNGAGIPEDVQDKIFDDFFSTKGSEGTGMGLLVAHKITEEHGGTISFESKEEEGTTFRAVIPGNPPGDCQLPS